MPGSPKIFKQTLQRGHAQNEGMLKTRACSFSTIAKKSFASLTAPHPGSHHSLPSSSTPAHNFEKRCVRFGLWLGLDMGGSPPSWPPGRGGCYTVTHTDCSVQYALVYVCNKIPLPAPRPSPPEVPSTYLPTQPQPLTTLYLLFLLHLISHTCFFLFSFLNHSELIRSPFMKTIHAC